MDRIPVPDASADSISNHFMAEDGNIALERASTSSSDPMSVETTRRGALGVLGGLASLGATLGMKSEADAQPRHRDFDSPEYKKMAMARVEAYRVANRPRIHRIIIEQLQALIDTDTTGRAPRDVLPKKKNALSEDVNYVEEVPLENANKSSPWKRAQLSIKWTSNLQYQVTFCFQEQNGDWDCARWPVTLTVRQ